jgi:hypothetical protein
MNEKLEAIRLAAHAELARHPAVRPWWVDAGVLLFVNLLFGAGSMLLLTTPVGGFGPLRWGAAAALLAVCALGTFAAVRPGWRSARFALLGLAGVTMALVLITATGFDPGRPFLGGMGCGLWEGLASVVPVIAAMLVLSRFAPDPLRTVVGGLAAGAGGLLALHLHCPNGMPSHLIVFHLVPWGLVSLAALGLRRLLRSSSWAP